MPRERVTILGSTGSIGVSTLDVLARQHDRFEVYALTAQSNVERLAEQCLEHRPAVAVMVDPEAGAALRDLLARAGSLTEVRSGAQALATAAAAPEVDIVMAAIVGAAGLLPTLAAAESGKRLLLANKESLVMSGALLIDAVARSGARLLPVDSEHNAIFQCLPAGYRCADPIHPHGAQRIWLTASGGPFRDRPLETFDAITPDEACAHPNWEMGRKISVDSATMMNKGLEVIEARWLFALEADAIRVVLHPQSIVHSMVAYSDGSVLAQLGQPDMRTPIAHALAWPGRMASGVGALDLLSVGRLDFAEPSPERFPCLGLAYRALTAGGTATTVLNAANEVAVAAFLDERMPFTAIARVIDDTLAAIPVEPADSLERILALDARARDYAGESVAGRATEQ
ncbi:1-deoxy-D-xylulose 5-phosphate reductoisomerase [Thioalkalivibrio nitratireducens DSM 14787]|uniref:1-deoxy-D-xylulose 5-phosphate reductoisomerase n=1 Tax=Thioalkalivibrio nitratireducens (strain DSM 14787 / UNIQEM 213 / ALEN2) TaxID=1255043 RepID=L0DX93_THIND|nr:1-deoxy-D-xylulose-5-phosphate reductoisomerase [Thioalkalivibrio nitratireducens]AGA33627.1 1-deoxy-D-xylulose 5-phosphate reductoisomerase [Thioalkalivibrio nitratireducens DSM 14787]